MGLDTPQIIQATVGLLTAVVMLIVAYGAPFRVSVGTLLVLIPFQVVETRYASANVLMTFVLVGALMLRGRLKYAPMLGPVLLILFAYLISMSQVNKVLYVWHGLQVFFLVSGFVVFFLAYNLAREVENPRFIVNLFVISNVIAVVYCLIQFAIGPGEEWAPFGVDYIAMHQNRGGGDPRLVGPFGTPGVTAAYFMTMTLMLTYEILYCRGRRKLGLILLAAANVGMLIATASRGSFLVLIAGLLGFLYLFRAQLGLMRIVQLLLGSTVVLVATTFVVVSYSDFGDMLQRLGGTMEIEDGLPETRSEVWEGAFEHIPEKPFLGHGPALFSERQAREIALPPGELQITYPHNLYLDLLITVGMLGTACVLWFLFGAVWRVYVGAATGVFPSDYERGWVVMGVLVLGTFLVDQLKQEFIRYVTTDYVHFVFAIYGIFLGWADRARIGAYPVREAIKFSPPSFVTENAVLSPARLQEHGG